MSDLINNHINRRFNFSYICIAVSAWFEKHKLRGIANWLHIQYLQENNNTIEFIKFLVDNDFPLKFDSVNRVNEFWTKNSETFDFLYSVQLELLEETKQIAAYASADNHFELYQFMVKYKNYLDETLDYVCRIRENLYASEASESRISTIDNELSNVFYIS